MAKKSYWVTDQGMLISGSGNIKISNGTKISRSKYYKLKREKERMNRELEEDGFSFSDDGTEFFLDLPKRKA